MSTGLSHPTHQNRVNDAGLKIQSKSKFAVNMFKLLVRQKSCIKMCYILMVKVINRDLVMTSPFLLMKLLML